MIDEKLPEFANESSNGDIMDEDSLDEYNLNLARLTSKKKEYLKDAIIDKNGAYSYLEDPSGYKKARKRL
jgi:hypothetical protein